MSPTLLFLLWLPAIVEIVAVYVWVGSRQSLKNEERERLRLERWDPSEGRRATVRRWMIANSERSEAESTKAAAWLQRWLPLLSGACVALYAVVLIVWLLF